MLVPLRGWVLLCCLIGLVALSYYRMFGELPVPTSKDEQTRIQLAQRWAQKVAAEVRRLPGRPLLAVARVVNDSDGILTGQLKTWIARRNVRMVNDQWYADLQYASGLADEPNSIDMAIQPLVGNDVDYIVAAEVANWTTFPEYEAVLRGHVEIRDGRTGDPVLHFQLALADVVEVVSGGEVFREVEVADRDHALSPITHVTSQPRDPQTNTAEMLATHSLTATFPGAPVAGLMLWFGSVLSLPLMGCTRLRKLLAKRSNRTNLGLLASWVLVTGVLAVTLWIRLLPVLHGVLTGIPAVLLAAAYFGFCCRCLDKSA